MSFRIGIDSIQYIYLKNLTIDVICEKYCTDDLWVKCFLNRGRSLQCVYTNNWIFEHKKTVKYTRFT